VTDADPPPSVCSREAFLRNLQEHATPATADQATFGLVLVKLSHLRDINNAFGFSAGDDCLNSIGRRLLDTVRPHDLVGHLGGGLFGVLVAEPCDEALLELAINRMLDELKPSVTLGERSIAIACRAAGGLYRDHGPTPDALLAARRSITASSRSTTSRSCAWTITASPVSKRCCAGNTRSTHASHPNA
jgi:diguanylate cyclase (GGDEF)-like protein